MRDDPRKDPKRKPKRGNPIWSTGKTSLAAIECKRRNENAADLSPEGVQPVEALDPQLGRAARGRSRCSRRSFRRPSRPSLGRRAKTCTAAPSSSSGRSRSLGPEGECIGHER